MQGPSPRAGLYGKLPARADFVTFGLPRAFVEPWDTWLQAAIHASRERLGDDWLDCYLSAPVWRFALDPGLCGPMAAAGIIIPSVDAANRHFPLTLVRLVPAPASALVLATSASRWFAAGEACVLACLDAGLDLDRLRVRLDEVADTLSGTGGGAGVATPSVAAGPSPPIGADAGATWVTVAPATVETALSPASCVVLLDALRCRQGAGALWWSTGSERVPAAVAMTTGLPEPESFAAFLADSGDDRAGAAGPVAGDSVAGDSRSAVVRQDEVRQP